MKDWGRDFGDRTGFPGAEEQEKDNWLGAIILIALSLIAVLLLLGWELIGGPFRITELLTPAGVFCAVVGGMCAFVAALHKGEDPLLVRSTIGFIVATLGFALLGSGFVALHPVARVGAAIGLGVVARVLWRVGRDLLEVEGEERYSRSRSILLALWLAYTAATLQPVGSLRVAALMLLVWSGGRVVSDRTRRLRAQVRDMFRPAEPEYVEIPAPIDPDDHLTPLQRMVARGIRGFIAKNFEKEGWLTVEISSVFNSPGFETYVLRVPTGIKSAVVIRSSDDLARHLNRHENEINILPGGRHGGVLIQISKPADQRNKLWYDEVLKTGAGMRRNRPMGAVIGVDERDQPVVVDIDDSSAPHLLIAGSSGSGKSYMMHVILTQILAENSPQNVQLAVIDPKGTFAMRYERVPHLFAPVVKGTEGAVELMKAVSVELERRRVLFEAASASSLRDYLDTARQPMPIFLFVIDEAASLSNSDDKALAAAYAQHVRAIAEKGRAFGMFLLIGVQRPSVENVGKFGGNLATRIILRLNKARESGMALDDEGDDSATKLGGRGDGFLIVNDTRRRFSGAYLPDEPDDDAKRVHKEELTVRNVMSAIIGHWGGPKDWGRSPDPTRPVPTGAGTNALSAEHNDDCDDREWLVICGVRSAVGTGSDPFAVTTFSPESLQPFVRRAAEERGYAGPEIKAKEIQQALARMYPERDGRPQRSREWPFNRALVEGIGGQAAGSLVGRFAARPDEAATGTTTASDRVADVARRARRGL